MVEVHPNVEYVMLTGQQITRAENPWWFVYSKVA